MLMPASSQPSRHGVDLDSHCFRKGALLQKSPDRSLASRSWHSLSARDNSRGEHPNWMCNVRLMLYVGSVENKQVGIALLSRIWSLRVLTGFFQLRRSMINSSQSSNSRERFLPWRLQVLFCFPCLLIWNSSAARDLLHLLQKYSFVTTAWGSILEEMWSKVILWMRILVKGYISDWP